MMQGNSCRRGDTDPGRLLAKRRFWAMIVALIIAVSDLAAISEAGKRYRQPDGYFTVEVPGGWQVKADGPSTSVYRGNFYVTILVFENMINSAAAVAHVTQQFAQQWKDFTKGPGGAFPLGKLEAGTYALYRGVNPAGLRAKLEVLGASDGKRSYVMLLSGPVQAWNDFDQEWHDILYGFELCSAPDSNCAAPGGGLAAQSPGGSVEKTESPSPNRAIMGAKCRDITPADLGRSGLTTMQGALITELLPNGPAANAGIESGDVIGTVGDQSVRNCPDLFQALSGYHPGETVEVLVLQRGRSRNVVIRLAKPGGSAERLQQSAAGTSPSPASSSLTSPSRSLVPYQGTDFAVSIPANWTATVSGSGLTTYLSARDGRRAQKDGAMTILLGMILGFQASSATNLKSAAAKQAEDLASQNPGLRILERRSAKLGGLPAESMLIEDPSPIPGEQEKTWLLLTLQKKTICFVTLTSPLRDFAGLQPVFEQIVSSIRFTAH
jgi:hypothetical protein